MVSDFVYKFQMICLRGTEFTEGKSWILISWGEINTPKWETSMVSDLVYKFQMICI
jgi:hypothetical protein